MYEKRLSRLVAAFALVFALIAGRAFLVQVLDVGSHRAEVDGGREFSVLPRRGAVLAADGSPLAWSVPGYSLEIEFGAVDDRLLPTPEAFAAERRLREEREARDDAAALAALASAAEREAEAHRRVREREQRRTARDELAGDLVRLTSELPTRTRGPRVRCRVCGHVRKLTAASRSTCPECRADGQCDELAPIDRADLAALVQRDVFDIDAALVFALRRREWHPDWRSHALLPRIPADAAEAIDLHPEQFGGLRAVPRIARESDPDAAPVIGAARAPTPDDVADLTDPKRAENGERVYVRAEVFPALFGASRLEEAHDEELRGVPGRARRTLRPRAGGGGAEAVVETLAEVVDGTDLVTTLRPRVQHLAQELVRAAPGGRDASAVVLDVRTGALVALASATDDGMDHARSHVVPGSVYKLVTAVALLEAGISPDERVECRHRERRAGHVRYSCMHLHGDIALVDAFADSCNGYFAQLAVRAGSEAMVDAARRLGLEGNALAADLGTRGTGPAGLDLASPGARGWFPADLAMLGIGQGRGASASPLQIAVAYARIANGGHLVEPTLLARNLRAPGAIPVDPVLARFAPLLRDAARRVVTEGTAEGVPALAAVRAAGKTGTAEVWQRTTGDDGVNLNTAWFVGYAPYDAPRYCAVFVVERMEHKSYGADVSGDPVAALLAEALVEQ